ncbi:tail assembly chaperone [Leuconostoc lactis]|uniref:tail assembly chaperone n=1 Tax=Leuconostoc lactis TaxID=1246 RepID=UPI002FE18CC9
MDVTVNKTTNTLKFNFKALFNANRDFSSTDQNGNNMGDGATNLFVRLVSGDPSALVDVIKAAGGFPKATDDDLFAAIDELTEDGDKVDEVMAEMKDELKNSGFFKKSIMMQKEGLETALPILQAKEQTEEVAQQVAALERILKLLNENL